MIHFNNEAGQTKTLDDNGAFFAFSNEQMDKCANRSLTYKSLGAGLYCPENNVDLLAKQLKENHSFKIQWELDNNSLKDIIWYELANYESQIDGDITEAVLALSAYGISTDAVKKEYASYYQHCIDNDYF